MKDPLKIQLRSDTMSDYLKKLDEALKQITKYTTITDNRYNKADGTPNVTTSWEYAK